MKLLFILGLLVFGRVSAQESEGGSGEEIIGCYQGDLQNSSGTTVSGTNMIVPCDFSEGKGCQTKFEIRVSVHENQESYLSVNRKCTQLSSCYVNTAQSLFKCQLGQNDIRLCFECCSGHLCNDNLVPPERLL